MDLFLLLICLLVSFVACSKQEKVTPTPVETNFAVSGKSIDIKGEVKNAADKVAVENSVKASVEALEK